MVTRMLSKPSFSAWGDEPLYQGKTMSLFFTQPLERGHQWKPKNQAVKQVTLTPEELDSCWYCEHCDTPMREEDDGFVDPQSRVSYCSESCRDDRVAEGWPA